MNNLVNKFLEQKKDYNKEDFMSRQDVLKRKTTIPESNDRILIVEPIFDGLGFKVKGWDQNFCRGRLSLEKFNNTIRRANRIIQHQWCKRKNMDLDGFAEKSKLF